MASTILTLPEDVWEYYTDYVADWSYDMGEEIIAYDEDLSLFIKLSPSLNGNPAITVEAEGDIVYEEDCFTPKDTEETCEQVYISFLEDYYGQEEEKKSCRDEVDFTEMEVENLIDKSENELDNAVDDFLSVVDSSFAYDDDVREDIKDHFLEYLYRKHGLKICRPMFLEGEDGEDFFEEYPYDHMIFDDPDNPVYKKYEKPEVNSK